MSEPQEWKKKYIQLEQKYEGEHASNQESQQLLCRIIIRLTLATKGLDPALDPYLTKLRDALKKGMSENARRHMVAISEALMRAHDDPKDKKSETKSDVNMDAGSLLQRLTEHARGVGRDGKRLKKLSTKIAADPESASDKDLDEFIHLLTGGMGGDAAQNENKTHLLGKIFGRGQKEGARASNEPIRLLISLLSELNWPGELGENISSLSARLEQQSQDAIVEVVKNLTEIVSGLLSDLNKETRATGSFLADLMAQLHELNSYVESGQNLQQRSYDSGKQLDQAVKEQVGGIATSVRDAKDLDALKSNVVVHLEKIKVHMDLHLQDAEHRYHESMENEKKLRERLKEVEDETGVLRNKILEAQAKSSMDAVTGLPNRAAYDERMKDEFTRWQRFNSPLVLMVWDLDDFKQVNDRFGHQAGDKALRVIGQTLKKRLRQTDFVGRYGGEEFCVLLPNTPMDQAAVVAEEIRSSVESSGFHSGDKPVQLTISCGYSAFQSGDTPDMAFARADKALYEAKSAGKNCCIGA